MASLPSEPEDRARRKIAEGNPAGTLADLAKQARLVVVGARGCGGFFEQLRGSVAAPLPAHAHCPTIVFSGTDSTEADAKNETFVEQKPGGPIVAAIDSSAQSTEVLKQRRRLQRRPPLSSGSTWSCRW